MPAKKMLAAFLEQNPDHVTALKKHEYKPDWELREAIDTLVIKEPRVWMGNMTVTGSYYRAGNVTQSAGREMMQIMLAAFSDPTLLHLS